MIKRIFGVASTLGVVALVIFTALGAGSYKSMLPAEFFDAIGLSDTPSVEQVEQPEVATDLEAEASAESEEEKMAPQQ